MAAAASARTPRASSRTLEGRGPPRTTTMKPFLTARWTNLILANYAVESALLEPHLPPGCELDTLDGSALLSLVAFDFLDTKVFGVAWPFHTDFPEVNLRFYIRHEGRRGVCFIKELVPKEIIAWAARAIYNEPYEVAQMSSRVRESADAREVDHLFRMGDATGSVHVVTDATPTTPTSDSEAHFFKEHELGVGKSRRGELLTYKVDHPVWAAFRVRSHAIQVDFAGIYGRKWRVLERLEPRSVLCAEGSEVSVYPVSSADT